MYDEFMESNVVIGKCFVLMPFAENFREVYERIYKHICEDNNIKCWRVDERQSPGSITKDIIDGILDADIIIADLTSKNANVFYELGFAHSIGKPVILTAQNGNDVPFDIQSYRVIFYEQSIAGRDKLLKKLDLAIKELLNLNPPRDTNNPIRDALYERKLIIQHLSHPVLSKPLIKQLIKLHKASVAFRVFAVIDDTLYRHEANIDLLELEDLTDDLYDKIIESAELLAGFRGRVIGDIYEFLKQQFTKDDLRQVLQNMQDIILSKEHSRLEKRARARLHIWIIGGRFIRLIEDEIDKLEP